MNIRMICVALVAVAIGGAEGKLAPPKIEDYTHFCRKCGKTTHYPTSGLGPRSFIAEYRKGCANLRARPADWDREVSLRNIAKDARIFVNSVSMSLLTSQFFVGTASARKN